MEEHEQQQLELKYDAALAGEYLQDDPLEYTQALDNLHLDIILQLLQAGADVQAVTAQVRPAAMLCISALVLSSHKLLEDMVVLHKQPWHTHSRRMLKQEAVHSKTLLPYRQCRQYTCRGNPNRSGYSNYPSHGTCNMPWLKEPQSTPGPLLCDCLSMVLHNCMCVVRCLLMAL